MIPACAIILTQQIGEIAQSQKAYNRSIKLERWNGMSQAFFKVEEISCGHCTSRIEKALAELEGVSKVSASVDDKMVEVTYDSEKLTVDDLIDEFDAIGFDAMEA